MQALFPPFEMRWRVSVNCRAINFAHHEIVVALDRSTALSKAQKKCAELYAQEWQKGRVMCITDWAVDAVLCRD